MSTVYRVCAYPASPEHEALPKLYLCKLQQKWSIARYEVFLNEEEANQALTEGMRYFKEPPTGERYAFRVEGVI